MGQSARATSGWLGPIACPFPREIYPAGRAARIMALQIIELQIIEPQIEPPIEPQAEPHAIPAGVEAIPNKVEFFEVPWFP